MALSNLCPSTVKPCDSSPCQNGGSCENNEDSFICTCAEGFKGDTCEEEGKVARVRYLVVLVLGRGEYIS